MAEMKPLEIPMRKFDDRVTLKVSVRITREFRFRTWLACKCVALAARIMGCNFSVDFTDAAEMSELSLPENEGTE